MPMALKEFAPPAAPLCISDPQPAQNYVILEVGAKWGGAVLHPSPARMMAFSLSGCTRRTASSGESHTFVAGDCLLHDDTSGKGHSTEVTLISIKACAPLWVFHLRSGRRTEMRNGNPEQSSGPFDATCYSFRYVRIQHGCGIADRWRGSYSCFGTSRGDAG
jgi:hypothetical protein